MLNDCNSGKWVSMLADRALATDWKSAASTEMLSTLLCLPEPVLLRVLSSCLVSQPLLVLFNLLPWPLSRSLISAATNEAMDLEIPNLVSGLDLFLANLSSARFPPPGLRQLSAPLCPRAVCTTVTAALFARAAAAHPSLEQLHITGVTASPALLRQLHTSLSPAALPCLQGLRIVCEPLPSIFIELAALLKKLPTVSRLVVNLLPLSEAQSSNNQHPLSQYGRSIFSTTRLGALQRMDIVELQRVPPTDGQQHRALPGASHLLLPLLCAPSLTQMRFQLASSCDSLPDLFNVLTPFTALRYVYAEVPRFQNLTPLLAMAKGAASDPLHVLPSLETLHIKSPCVAAPVAVAAVLAARAPTSLTRLTLRHPERCTPGTVAVSDVHDAWAAAWGALKACSSLRHLELCNLCTSIRERGRGDEALDSNTDVSHVNDLMAAAIQSMPMLTTLLLRGVPRQISTGVKCDLLLDALGDAIGDLQELRSVSLCSCAAPMQVHPASRAEELAELMQGLEPACKRCGRVGGEGSRVLSGGGEADQGPCADEQKHCDPRDVILYGEAA